MFLVISGSLCSESMCVWGKLRCRGGRWLLLTELLWFFSLHLLMEFETQKDTGSCSLKSSLLSVCLFPFLKGHLHNSEQPACLAFLLKRISSRLRLYPIFRLIDLPFQNTTLHSTGHREKLQQKDALGKKDSYFPEA